MIILKAHIQTYTKRDGTVVAAHNDRRPGAKVPSDPDTGDLLAQKEAPSDGATFPPEATKAVASLKAKYPELAGMDLKWNDLGDNDVMANAGGGHIYLNSHYWARPDTIAKINEEWDGIVVDSSVTGTINHEAGHALGQIIEKKIGQKKAQEIFSAAFGGEGFVDQRDITPGIHVSPYAQENIWEMRAETFAAVQVNRTTWPPDSPYHDLSLNAAKQYWKNMQEAYKNYTAPTSNTKRRGK